MIRIEDNKLNGTDHRDRTNANEKWSAGIMLGINERARFAQII